MTCQILTQTSKSGNTLNGATVDTIQKGLQWKTSWQVLKFLLLNRSINKTTHFRYHCHSVPVHWTMILLCTLLTTAHYRRTIHGVWSSLLLRILVSASLSYNVHVLSVFTSMAVCEICTFVGYIKSSRPHPTSTTMSECPQSKIQTLKAHVTFFGA